MGRVVSFRIFAVEGYVDMENPWGVVEASQLCSPGTSALSSSSYSSSHGIRWATVVINIRFLATPCSSWVSRSPYRYI